MEASVEAEFLTFTFAPVIQPVKEMLSSTEESEVGAVFVSCVESLPEEVQLLFEAVFVPSDALLLSVEIFVL